jgi:peptidyl-prolyl cis-trans isomerase A (cyclophilin A)
MKKKEHNKRHLIFGILILLIIAAIAYLWVRNMKTIIVFETSMGNFEVELNQEKAPITVKNFLSYINEGYYNGLIFHRVMDGFMIQGGGFSSDMKEKQTNSPIKNEADNGLKNLKYTIAMARTGEVDSATSQFFINTADNSFLDHGVRDFGYAVFGKVSSGQDIIDKIGKVKTHSVGYFDDVPISPIIINKAYRK